MTPIATGPEYVLVLGLVCLALVAIAGLLEYLAAR
jgi:hypothetical protein